MVPFTPITHISVMFPLGICTLRDLRSLPCKFPFFYSGDSVRPATTCFLGPEFVSQIPRVWYYVRRARGTIGGHLVLPCRVLDQDVDTTTAWYFRGARLVPSLSSYKYEVRVMETLPAKYSN